jgi:cobalt-zinc-cadmium efflux system protein
MTKAGGHSHALHGSHGSLAGEGSGPLDPGAVGRLRTAMFLIIGFMVVEVAVSVPSRSLALLADAGHMLTDAGALAGSLWAIRLASRPASRVWSYGLKRAEILAAAANGVTLVVVGALIFSEAVRRLIHPSVVHGVPMLSVAVGGMAVNLAASLVLARTDHRSLNLRAAFAHVVTDLYASAGTAIAALVIILSHWYRADPVASVVVAALVLRTAWSLLRESGHVLLEGTPKEVDLDQVRAHIAELEEVVDVHDLHAWTLTSALPALSAHVVIDDACLSANGTGPVLDRLQACVADHFDVEHSTFQLEAVSHLDHESGIHP